MKLYRTERGPVLERDGDFFALAEDWDALVNHDALAGYLESVSSGAKRVAGVGDGILAPVGSQEIWAAGVTYQRSRVARIEEAETAGGGTFYDRVYTAERPELFFKAAAWRARGHGMSIRIRRDATWSVPEPELALCVNARGEIVGYSIGNDVSSRDIEGENPLYLPQAKIYDGACALGPCLLVKVDALEPETAIELVIQRAGSSVFEGGTTLSRMRRTPGELVEYLVRETSFPQGCMLLTGTGIVPPDSFSLESGDIVEIRIPPIGTLRNSVE